MVQAPSFLTLAEHDVRKLRSRSVAVMESRSPPASNKKLERMGMVVLRSTTPWVAVSSRRSSARLTVISIVEVPAAVMIASAGIKYHLGGVCADPRLLCSPYIKRKTIKTSSNSRLLGNLEIQGRASAGGLPATFAAVHNRP